MPAKTLTFNDASEGNDLLAAHGFCVRGTQLDEGELNGSLSASQVGDAVFLLIENDRRLLFHGGRMPGHTPLCFQVGDGCYFHGYDTCGRGLDLCGFRSDLTDTHVHWAGQMCASFLPTQKLRGYLYDRGMYDALERMDRTNKLRLSLNGTQALQRLFSRGLHGDIKDHEKVYGAFALMLEDPESLEGPPNPKFDRELRMIVSMAHEQSRKEPLLLDEVLIGLGLQLSQKRTLQQKCREAYGMGVTQIMKRVRMEEARLSILKDGLNVAGTVRRHVFVDTKQFSKDYKRVFGCNPSLDVTRAYPRLKLKGT